MSNINKQALRERYSEKPSPKCHICGAVMTIQRAGSGGVVYGCTGRIDRDGEGYKFEDGRDFADDHYSRSRVTDYSPSGDPDVLALLDELEAKDRRNAELNSTLERWATDRAQSASELDDAEKSNVFLKGQLAELANFNPDWDKLEASYESWREIAAELLVAKDRIAELEQRLNLKPCPKCNDTGMADSGGTQPWGEPIEIECDCRQQDANTAELVAAGIITKVGG